MGKAAGGGGGGGSGINILGGIHINGAVVFGKYIKDFGLNNPTFFTPVDSNGSIVKLNTSQPFEIGMTVRFSNVAGSMALCGQYGAARWGSGNRAPSIVPSDGTSCAFAFPGSSGWGKLLNPIPSGYTLPVDTDILFKMSWDGATAYAYIYDGANTMTASDALDSVYYNASNYMVFANQGQSTSGIPVYASYDFTKSLYMKQSGVLIWGKE